LVDHPPPQCFITGTGALRLVREGVAQAIALNEASKTPIWSI